MTQTLFARLGGGAAIRAVVDDFYRRVLADASLAAFFADVDLAQQRAHLAAFVGTALGGPDGYRGRPLREAHAALAITDRDFDAVAGHLEAALAGAGVGDVDRATIVGTVASLRGEVVTAAARR